ncbi:MAG TPA: ATPase, T2SS/T4P/T4SS family, partial [Chloroflexota bacterium]|nr:ATPase, T2SS/T4P/T4SS family [Chloroflexota bacterium]
RMRPTRILVGEVRGGESLDMILCMNTGHDGSLTTVHGNSPRDALERLTTLAMMAEERLSYEALSRMVARTIDLGRAAAFRCPHQAAAHAIHL